MNKSYISPEHFFFYYFHFSLCPFISWCSGPPLILTWMSIVTFPSCPGFCCHLPTTHSPCSRQNVNVTFTSNYATCCWKASKGLPTHVIKSELLTLRWQRLIVLPIQYPLFCYAFLSEHLQGWNHEYVMLSYPVGAKEIAVNIKP